MHHDARVKKPADRTAAEQARMREPHLVRDLDWSLELFEREALVFSGDATVWGKAQCWRMARPAALQADAVMCVTRGSTRFDLATKAEVEATVQFRRDSALFSKNKDPDAVKPSPPATRVIGLALYSRGMASAGPYVELHPSDPTIAIMNQYLGFLEPRPLPGPTAKASAASTAAAAAAAPPSHVCQKFVHGGLCKKSNKCPIGECYDCFAQAPDGTPLPGNAFSGCVCDADGPAGIKGGPAVPSSAAVAAAAALAADAAQAALRSQASSAAKTGGAPAAATTPATAGSPPPTTGARLSAAAAGTTEAASAAASPSAGDAAPAADATGTTGAASAAAGAAAAGTMGAASAAGGEASAIDWSAEFLTDDPPALASGAAACGGRSRRPGGRQRAAARRRRLRSSSSSAGVPSPSALSVSSSSSGSSSIHDPTVTAWLTWRPYGIYPRPKTLPTWWVELEDAPWQRVIGGVHVSGTCGPAVGHAYFPQPHSIYATVGGGYYWRASGVGYLRCVRCGLDASSIGVVIRHNHLELRKKEAAKAAAAAAAAPAAAKATTRATQPASAAGAAAAKAADDATAAGDTPQAGDDAKAAADTKKRERDVVATPPSAPTRRRPRTGTSDKPIRLTGSSGDGDGSPDPDDDGDGGIPDPGDSEASDGDVEALGQRVDGGHTSLPEDTPPTRPLAGSNPDQPLPRDWANPGPTTFYLSLSHINKVLRVLNLSRSHQRLQGNDRSKAKQLSLSRHVLGQELKDLHATIIAIIGAAWPELKEDAEKGLIKYDAMVVLHTAPGESALYIDTRRSIHCEWRVGTIRIPLPVPGMAKGKGGRPYVRFPTDWRSGLSTRDPKYVITSPCKWINCFGSAPDAGDDPAAAHTDGCTDGEAHDGVFAIQLCVFVYRVKAGKKGVPALPIPGRAGIRDVLWNCSRANGKAMELLFGPDVPATTGDYLDALDYLYGNASSFKPDRVWLQFDVATSASRAPKGVLLRARGSSGQGYWSTTLVPRAEPGDVIVTLRFADSKLGEMTVVTRGTSSAADAEHKPHYVPKGQGGRSRVKTGGSRSEVGDGSHSFGSGLGLDCDGDIALGAGLGDGLGSGLAGGPAGSGACSASASIAADAALAEARAAATAAEAKATAEAKAATAAVAVARAEAATERAGVEGQRAIAEARATAEAARADREARRADETARAGVAAEAGRVVAETRVTDLQAALQRATQTAERMSSELDAERVARARAEASASAARASVAGMTAHLRMMVPILVHEIQSRERLLAEAREERREQMHEREGASVRASQAHTANLQIIMQGLTKTSMTTPQTAAYATAARLSSVGSAHQSTAAATDGPSPAPGPRKGMGDAGRDAKSPGSSLGAALLASSTASSGIGGAEPGGTQLSSAADVVTGSPLSPLSSLPGGSGTPSLVDQLQGFMSALKSMDED